MHNTKVAIIGGGPGGLMTAYLLQKRMAANGSEPCAVTLLEAGPRLGGKIMTRQFSLAPVSYEAGAAELYDYSRVGPDPLRELVAELGLTTSPLAGETVVMDGRVLRDDADIRRELGEATLAALKRFDRRAHAAMSPGEYYESDWKEDNDDPLSRHTFRALLEKITDPVARRYVEVMVHSDVATEPELTSAMYGLQNYLMNDPAYMRLYTIDGGIERLPQELAKRIHAEARLNCPVTRVERAPGSLETGNDRYRVHFRRDGQMVHEEFDFVVVAIPNYWIPAVEWAGPSLGDAMRRHHEHYNYPAHYLRVTLLFQKPFWREQIPGSYFMLDAFGGCCVYDETSRDPAATHGALGWLLGGEAAMIQSNFDDATLIQRVLASLPPCLQHGRDLFMEGRVKRWVGTVNGMPGGRPMREPDSRHQPEPVEHPGLFVVGDYLFDSTLNGVLDSADTVAEWIVEEMAEDQPAPASHRAGPTIRLAAGVSPRGWAPSARADAHG